MIEKFTKKTEALLEALPYIQEFANSTVVIKYGGSIMGDEILKMQIATDITLLKYIGMNPVIIHGGGNEINKWLEKVGKQPVMKDGYRVTDSETMEIAEMVLGRISKEIVQMISKDRKTKAVSISGKDSHTLQVTKSSRDLGFVGEITEVDTSLLNTLIDSGNIPVISSIGIGSDNETYNINADHAAAAIASALKARKLILMTDVDGVLDKQNELIPKLTVDDAKTLIKDGTIGSGMIPKVTSCLESLSGGVDSVHIINGKISHVVLLELLTSHGVGTMITRN